MIVSLNYHRYHGRHCIGGHPVKTYTSQPEELKKGWKRCKCPILASGSLSREYKRVATKETDWTAAAAVMAPYIAAGSWALPEAPVTPPPTPPEAPAPTPATETPAPARKVKRNLLETEIKVATNGYYKVHEIAESAVSTMRRKKYLMRDIEEFSETHGLAYVDDWETETVQEFAATWKKPNGEKIMPSTRNKLMGDVKAFFRFCLDNRYTTYNPAQYKVVKNRATLKSTESKQKLAYSDVELDWMFAACRNFGKEEVRLLPKKKNGRQVEAIDEYCNYNRRYTGEDLMDFIALSAWTGLRISDVVLFNIERLNPDNTCKIRAMKNDKWVCTKLPDWLAERVRARAKKFGPVIFGPYKSERIDTLTQTWRDRNLKKLWEQCGPWAVPPNPHRFRHTFIRILLQNHVAVEVVADLVGDTPETIRKYYSDWAGERQTAVIAALETAFANVPNPFAPKRAKVLELKRG